RGIAAADFLLISTSGPLASISAMKGTTVNPTIFDTLTRRASLLRLGTAGLTAVLANPLSASARKKHGKSNSKKVDPNRLCKAQVKQCLDFFTPRCGDDVPCVEAANECCPVLGDCELAGFVDCVRTSS